MGAKTGAQGAVITVQSRQACLVGRPRVSGPPSLPSTCFQAAKVSQNPVIIQISQGGGAFYCGKGIKDTDYQVRPPARGDGA